MIIAGGVFLNWMDITITFTDGTGEVISASGLGLYTDYRGTGAPVESSTPILYLLIALGVAILALIRLREAGGAATAVFAMLVLLVAMILTGTMSVDSALMYAEPPAGVDVDGIPEWLTDIVGEDVSSARISGGYGYMVSVIGMLISTLAAMAGVRYGSAHGTRRSNLRPA